MMRSLLKQLMTVFLAVILVSQTKVSCAQEDLSWAEMIFKGSKFFSRLTVKIQLSAVDQISGDHPNGHGTDPVYCSEIPPDSKLLTAQFSSSGVGSAMGQYVEKIWFDKAATRPTKRIRISGGNDPWIKTYCWGDNGVCRQKITPGNMSESKQSPGRWSKYTASFYEYPQEVNRCDTISDPFLVFYVLSSLESVNKSKPLEMCVFGKTQVHLLTIAQEESSLLKVSYKAEYLSQLAVVEDQINPLVFSISTVTMVPDKGHPEKFSFLGLNKDIRIYMDPERRMPVKISGTHDIIGRVVLDLRAYSK